MENKDFHNEEEKKNQNLEENKNSENEIKEEENSIEEKSEEMLDKNDDKISEEKNLEKEEKKESFSEDTEEEKKKEVKKALLQGSSNEDKNNNNNKGNKKGPKVSINFKNIVLLIFLIILIMSLPTMFDGTAPKHYNEVTYTEFLKSLENGRFESIEEKEGYLYAQNIETKENYKTKMITTRISEDERIMKEVEEKDVVLKSLEADKLPFLVSILVSWFPMLLLIFVWIFMLNRMNKGSSGGGGPQIFNMGKSKAKEGGEVGEKVTFNDVAGADEAKLELLEIVQFLKEPKKFQEIGARIPKGVLLKGQPGTGKTLIAKAVAGEAGVPFFSMSGSEFVEMFVGVGASRVRDLFNKARKAAPCIVFIDEIDAVGRKRGSGQGGGNDEREQTLNQLLVEMDGFGNDETIIVIAATNRDEILDKALMRPGRFDRQVVVDAPDILGREAILNVHIRGKKIGKNVDLKRIARKTAGFVGADLANMLNEAAIMAARAGRKIILMEDIEEATEKVAYGPAKKSRVISEKEKKTVAYHEAGHALVNVLLDHTIPAYKVTIIPRGGAGGYLMQIPTEEKILHMKREMLANIRVAYGGRVAEEVIFEDISSGASNDIMQATATAIHMVTKLGMADVGRVLYDATRDGDYYKNHTFYSPDTGRELDKEIRKILDDAYADTKKLITENIDALHRIASALLEYETITGEELDDIVYNQKGTVGKIDELRESQKIPEVNNIISSDEVVVGKAREYSAEEELDENQEIEVKE
jgi:cell division protease FtsH